MQKSCGKCEEAAEQNIVIKIDNASCIPCPDEMVQGQPQIPFSSAASMTPISITAWFKTRRFWGLALFGAATAGPVGTAIPLATPEL